MSWTILKNPLLGRSFTIRPKPENQEKTEIIVHLHGGQMIDVTTNSFARKACDTLEKELEGLALFEKLSSSCTYGSLWLVLYPLTTEETMIKEKLTELGFPESQELWYRPDQV